VLSLRSHVVPAQAPSLDLNQFLEIIDFAEESLRPAFITLAVTGISLQNLGNLKREDLLSDIPAVRVSPEGESESVRLVYVAPSHWPFVVASVPLRAELALLYNGWREAVYLAGLPPTRITALRRLAVDQVVADGLPRLLARAALGRRPHQVWREDDYRVVAFTLSALIKLDLTSDETRKLVIRLM
jgi:hypothetical protein